MSKSTKKRSSIITIIIVILLLGIIAISVISLLNHISENNEIEEEQYISNLYEEDLMQYEYDKIDDSLDGMYSFAISNNYLVGVISKEKIVNIVPIDPQKQYDYVYNDAKVYLLEKESGIINIIDLKEIGKIINTVELNDSIESFNIYDNTIYYIANNKLIKYDNATKEEILDNITSKNFVIKNDNIFIVKNNNLIKLDKELNETVIAENVLEIDYYNYYERDRLVFTTSIDNENIFKNVYNFYTENITQFVKNNTFFVPYSSDKYIYTNFDNTSVILIKNADINKYLSSFDKKIEKINLFKEGYLVIVTEDKITTFDLETEKEVQSDNIISLDNIKYIKF